MYINQATILEQLESIFYIKLAIKIFTFLSSEAAMNRYLHKTCSVKC